MSFLDKLFEASDALKRAAADWLEFPAVEPATDDYVLVERGADGTKARVALGALAELGGGDGGGGAAPSITTLFAEVTGNIQTNSGAWVDMAGAARTVDLGATDIVLVTASISAGNSSSGGGVQAAIAVDGVRVTAAYAAKSGASSGISMQRRFTGLGAGEHTFKLQWSDDGEGTSQCFAAAGTPATHHANIMIVVSRGEAA